MHDCVKTHASYRVYANKMQIYVLGLVMMYLNDRVTTFCQILAPSLIIRTNMVYHTLLINILLASDAVHANVISFVACVYIRCLD